MSLAGDLARIGGGVVAVKGQRQNPSVGHTTQIDNASESEFNYPKDPITFADVDAFHRIVHESICGAPEVGMTPKVFLVTGNKNADLGGLSPPTAGQQPPPNAPAEATQIANSAKTPILSKSAPPSSEGQRAFDRGMVHVQQGNLDLAIKEFSSAIDAAPKYAAAFSNRGVAQLRQKNFGRALDDFKKAVELEPQNPVWHYNMAAYYSLKQETDRGLDSLDQALKLGFAKSDNTQIDLLKFDAKADADLANLRKRRTDYCAVLERHSKFLCK